MTRYEVTKRTPDGTYLGAVAGMGRNRGTWDSAHVVECIVTSYPDESLQ